MPKPESLTTFRSMDVDMSRGGESVLGIIVSWLCLVVIAGWVIYG